MTPYKEASWCKTCTELWHRYERTILTGDRRQWNRALAKFDVHRDTAHRHPWGGTAA